MKAVICPKYGPPEVLRLVEVESPVPKDNELLVRMRAVVVATEDPLQRRGEPYFTRIFLGLWRPRKPILGAEFAGEVQAVGSNVKRFKPGDRVFGSTGLSAGCYAEYACVPEDGLVSIKPANITDEEAAPVCSALTAWNFLKAKANLRSGQRVLINGASGSVGSAAVQTAKTLGAEVTGVCSTSNLELVKSLGADRVIDYTREDFVRNGQTYDVIFDVAGKSSFSRCKDSLAPGGVYLGTVPRLSTLLETFWTRRFGEKKAVFSATGLLPIPEQLAFLREVIELFVAEKLKTVIDRRYPLEQIVEAHRCVEQGGKRGNVVITFAP